MTTIFPYVSLGEAYKSAQQYRKSLPPVDTRMVRYHRHNCSRNHRSYAAMAKCLWGSNVDGDGPYAVVHWLKIGHYRAYPDVLLYDTAEEATEKYVAMCDPFYCGGSCRNAGGNHKLIELVK